MKILLTGCNGQLGRCFLDRVPEEWDVLAMGHKELDVTSQESIGVVFEKYHPDVVVNAAAYTAVDRAEEDHDNAHAVNALGPKHLAENCAKTGAFMVHISTDYVFDGTATTPYLESDPISPSSVYGRTKAEGEAFVENSSADYVVLRTAWVFSEYGNNFVKTMLGLGETRTELSVVADQFGGPTYAGDLARAIINIIAKKSENAKIISGVYHFCGSPITTWADFAREIFNQANKHNLLPLEVIVNDITTNDYPTPAKRPTYSMMNCSKILNNFEIQGCDWKNQLKIVLNRF